MLLATFVTADKSSSLRGAKLPPSETNNARLRHCAASWLSPGGEAASGGHISFCEERNVKESRLDLRSKGPLARYELCKIGGADLAELVRRGTLLSVQGSLVPLAPLPLTAVRVGVGALVEWRLSNRAHCGAKHRNG